MPNDGIFSAIRGFICIYNIFLNRENYTFNVCKNTLTNVSLLNWYRLTTIGTIINVIKPSMTRLVYKSREILPPGELPFKFEVAKNPKVSKTNKNKKQVRGGYSCAEISMIFYL